MKPVALLVVLILACAFAAGDDSVPGLSLINCRVTGKGLGTAELLGRQIPADKYEIVSRTKVQTVCRYGREGVYEIKKNRYTIFVLHDTACAWLDSTYAAIDRNYGKIPGGLPDLRTGYLKHQGKLVPYITSTHQREGAFTVIWLKKKSYKIVLEESGGMGSMSSFRSQNFRFSD